MKQREESKGEVSRELAAPQSWGGSWEEPQKETRDCWCGAESRLVKGPPARHGHVSLTLSLLTRAEFSRFANISCYFLMQVSG